MRPDPDVPHFWHKKLTEDKLEELGVPFVALRPGAFLDQVTRFGGDAFSKGRLSWIGSPRIPLTFVLTSDVAGYPAEALDLPDLEGRCIDIGWDRPVATLQRQFFGEPPTAELAIRRFVTGLGQARPLGP
ncbi:chaperon-Like protein for quinone binding in photosystem II [Arthrobacter sp. Hiyo4]|nr:chaperon-Like protein for quinone binding in photosystem II [Arthrobacter sp. Hiyo4]